MQIEPVVSQMVTARAFHLPPNKWFSLSRPVLSILLVYLCACSEISNYEKGLIAFDRHDYAEALAYMKEEALRGNADAAYRVGNMYSVGLGVEQDPDISQHWFRKAVDSYIVSATAGDSKSQTRLCFIFSSGKGVKQDLAEAFKWCEKSAEQGEPMAQRNLSIFYANGNGVMRDLDRSRYWYSRYVQTMCGTPYTEQNCSYPELCECKK